MCKNAGHKSRIFLYVMLRKLNFHIVLLLSCLLLQLNMHAQRADSLRTDHTHVVYLHEVIAPSCMLVYGTLVTFSPDMSRVNLAVKDWTQEKAKVTTAVDDYLQLSPVTATYVLNVCGVKGVHRYGDLTALAALSYIVGTGVNTGIKYGIRVRRPDGSAHNSFPSGHTMTAFVGAEIMRREYGKEHPWIVVGGYAAAAVTGFLRISNNRHWLADVMAGASIGMLSTSLVYSTYPYLRSPLMSTGRCRGYVLYDGQGMQLGTSIALGKTASQPVAFPDFSLSVLP